MEDLNSQKDLSTIFQIVKRTSVREVGTVLSDWAPEGINLVFEPWQGALARVPSMCHSLYICSPCVGLYIYIMFCWPSSSKSLRKMVMIRET